jgi:hypothetical protein
VGVLVGRGVLSSGNQPAHQSMINRRFIIVPPAFPSGGRTKNLTNGSKEFLGLQLETASMRAACRGEVSADLFFWTNALSPSACHRQDEHELDVPFHCDEAPS